jgi:hypothetical protein
MCFLVLIIAVLALGCISVRPVLISEMGTCRGIDETDLSPVDRTKVFSPNESPIVLYFHLDTKLGSRLEYRWFHEGALVSSSVSSQDNYIGYNFAWLGAVEGEELPVGEYHVEVVLQGVAIRSTEFRVEE